MFRRNLEPPSSVSVVPISKIHVTLMKEALSSFETSVLTKATRRNIPDLYTSQPGIWQQGCISGHDTGAVSLDRMSATYRLFVTF
jgi:hypothetical protein